VDGFPEPGSVAEVTAGGLLHLAFGGVGFIALAVAALFVAGWFRDRDEVSRAGWARLAALFILIGFLGGAALAASPAGVALLWAAVLAGWAFLGLTSIRVYKLAPHPDAALRGSAEARSGKGGES
jgi:hypothetical protein